MKTFNSMVVNSRIDIRQFADLASFLTENGLSNLTQSAVVKYCLELLHSKLIECGKVKPINDPMEAKTVLDSLGILNAQRGRRGYNQFVKSVQSKTLEVDFGSSNYLNKPKPKNETNTSCELTEAMKLLEQKARQKDQEFEKELKNLVPKKEKKE